VSQVRTRVRHLLRSGTLPRGIQLALPVGAKTLRNQETILCFCQGGAADDQLRVRGVDAAAHLLHGAAQETQGLQDGQSHLPLHHSSRMRHHVPRGKITARILN